MANEIPSVLQRIQARFGSGTGEQVAPGLVRLTLGGPLAPRARVARGTKVQLFVPGSQPSVLSVFNTRNEARVRADPSWKDGGAAVTIDTSQLPLGRNDLNFVGNNTNIRGGDASTLWVFKVAIEVKP